jgi:molecular chaperone GrpE
MAKDKSTKQSHGRESADEHATLPESGAELDAGGGDAPHVELVHDGGAGADAELAECRDRLLRMQAEMENVRWRTAREIADERRYAALPMVRDLLEVLDNVDRAIEAGEKTPDAGSLLEGFRMVGKQLRSLLEKHEVKSIAAEGELFDPNLHEAILQQPSDQPKGTVVLVTQGGYQLHDRVVRPSQVIVSAGEA